jgi:hypothetical protein
MSNNQKASGGSYSREKKSFFHSPVVCLSLSTPRPRDCGKAIFSYLKGEIYVKKSTVLSSTTGNE